MPLRVSPAEHSRRGAACPMRRIEPGSVPNRGAAMLATDQVTTIIRALAHPQSIPDGPRRVSPAPLDFYSRAGSRLRHTYSTRALPSEPLRSFPGWR